MHFSQRSKSQARHSQPLRPSDWKYPVKPLKHTLASFSRLQFHPGTWTFINVSSCLWLWVITFSGTLNYLIIFIWFFVGIFINLDCDLQTVLVIYEFSSAIRMSFRSYTSPLFLIVIGAFYSTGSVIFSWISSGLDGLRFSSVFAIDIIFIDIITIILFSILSR